MDQNKSPNSPKSSYTFEEAITLIGSGIFHYELLLTCGLCFLAVMSQMLCISVILPSIKCDIQATQQQQSLLGAAAFFGIVCSSHLVGFLGDTYGRVKTLRLSILMSTIAAVISAFSINIHMLIATRFLTGFFASGCQACVFNLCSEFHSDRTRSHHVMLLSVFLPLGMVFVPVEAILILPIHIDIKLFGMAFSTWRLLLLAVNIPSVLAFICLCFTPESPKYDFSHGRHDKALKTMQKMYKMNTGRPIEEFPVEQLKGETTGVNLLDVHSFKDALKMIWEQSVRMFHKDLIWHTLNICFILFLIYGIAHGLLIWYPTILVTAIEQKSEYMCKVISRAAITGPEEIDVCTGEESKKKLVTLMSWLMAFVGTVFTIIYFIFSWMVRCVKMKNLSIFYFLFCSAFCIAVHWISNLVMLVTALTFISAVGSCSGTISTIAVESFPTNISAMSMCFVMMIGRLGAASGSYGFGFFLFDYCNATFWGLAVMLLIMALLSWFLPGPYKSKHPDAQ